MRVLAFHMAVLMTGRFRRRVWFDAERGKYPLCMSLVLPNTGPIVEPNEMRCLRIITSSEHSLSRYHRPTLAFSLSFHIFLFQRRSTNALAFGDSRHEIIISFLP